MYDLIGVHEARITMQYKKEKMNQKASEERKIKLKGCYLKSKKINFSSQPQLKMLLIHQCFKKISK